MEDQAALDALIAAAQPVLGIAVQDAWRPAIRMHLAISLRLANTLSGFALPDEAEPAPVFVA